MITSRVKIYHNVILSDLTCEFWEKINIEDSLNAVLDILEKSENDMKFALAGTMEPDDSMASIDLTKITHRITNIHIKNKKIFGSVTCLDLNPNCHALISLLNIIPMDNFVFKMRFAGFFNHLGKCTIKEIFSWDIYPKTSSDQSRFQYSETLR